MGGDLVEQQQRRVAVPRLGQFPRIGKHDGDQQRLLFAGRAFARVACASACGARQDRSGAARTSCGRLRRRGCALAPGVRAASSSAPSPARQEDIGLAVKRQLRRGNAPASPRSASARFRRSTVSARLMVIAMPASAISFSRPSSQAGSRGPNLEAARVRASRFHSAWRRGHGWRRSPAPGDPGIFRRPPALSMNRRSIAGVSQTICTMFAKFGGVLRRRAVQLHLTPFAAVAGRGQAGADFVVFSPRATVAATAHSASLGRRTACATCSPSLAPRRPRPGDRSEIASSTLVLPAPLGPASTTGRPLTAIRPQHRSGNCADAGA